MTDDKGTVAEAVRSALDGAGVAAPPRWGRRATWERGEPVIDDDGDEERR